MITAVADTHAAIWYLFSDPRLGKAASTFIEQAIAQGDHTGVSAISLAEMVYLVAKSRIPPNALNVPLDDAVAMKMTEVSRQGIRDLPDRVIAATAQLRGIPILSRDGRIRSSTLTTIW